MKADKFKRDYELVMNYWMTKNGNIEKVNEVVLSSKYYDKYKFSIKEEGYKVMYIESFLDFFEKFYDAVLLKDKLDLDLNNNVVKTKTMKI